jgi:hypothetical protein
MTDLTAVLPGFPSQQYVRLLPSLEKNLVTTADLLTLDCVEIAKRAQLPLLDVKRLCNAVLVGLQDTLGIAEGDDVQQNSLLRKTGKDILNSWSTVSTLDDDVDRTLGGGIPTGYITEVTGERCAAHNLQFIITDNLQWCREDPIPSHPTSLRTTSLPSWTLQLDTLHLHRKCPSHYSTLAVSAYTPYSPLCESQAYPG